MSRNFLNKSRLKSVEQTLAFVLGGTINEAAMKTETKLPLKDSLSRVKFVWAIVKDGERRTNCAVKKYRLQNKIFVLE